MYIHRRAPEPTRGFVFLIFFFFMVSVHTNPYRQKRAIYVGHYMGMNVYIYSICVSLYMLVTECTYSASSIFVLLRVIGHRGWLSAIVDTGVRFCFGIRYA